MLYSASTRGFYSDRVHGAAIPEDAVEVDDAEYSALLVAQSSGMQIVPGSEGRPTAVNIAIEAARHKAWGKERIDAAAEAARLQFVTQGAGQALVYQRKEAQARDCLAAHDANNPPPAGKYPALDAEIGINGADALSVAQVVVGLADAWGAIADQIEAARLSAKGAIDAVPDDAADLEAQIAAIEAGISWPTA